MIERMIVTTGGTGGHIFPALAVAEEIRRRNPDARVLFVGGSHGREKDFARKAGLEFVGLPALGILGRGLRAVGGVFRMGLSVLKAWWLMLRFKPQVVVGFGGYAGFAPVFAASVRGVPCAVHEQNSYPGAANRMLSKRVDRMFLSFPDDHDFFDSAKTVLTGNPVRSEIVRAGEKGRTCGVDRPCRRVLVVGGSQGARAINEAVVESLDALKDSGVELWHQTGELDYETVREGYETAGWTSDNARVEAFIDDMAAAYEWADIVLCRSGATTVFELAALGKPSLLVPFPHATHNHQMSNAQFLEQAGAAIILAQGVLGEIDLARTIDELFADPDRMDAMGKAARSQAKLEAASRMADEIEKLAKT